MGLFGGPDTMLRKEQIPGSTGVAQPGRPTTVGANL
jgi:hypothetical protein